VICFEENLPLAQQIKTVKEEWLEENMGQLAEFATLSLG
jgi:hypothetical protein